MGAFIVGFTQVSSLTVRDVVGGIKVPTALLILNI